MKNPYLCPYLSKCNTKASAFLKYTDATGTHAFGVCEKHLHKYIDANSTIPTVSKYKEITLDEAIIIEVMQS
jgi:hypothetical protein